MVMKYNRLLTLLTILLVGVTSSLAQEVKECYAFFESEEATTGTQYLEGKGIYSFDFDGTKMSNVKKYRSLNIDRSSGSCMVDGVYYWFDYTQSSKGHITNGFYSFDVETGETRQIANYGGTQGGEIVSHLTYDYTTRTMYAIYGPQSGSYLAKIDLETGQMTRLESFKMDEWPSVADSTNAQGERLYNESYRYVMNTIACNYDGDLYGLEYWGGLYRINKESGECTYIGKLDYMVETAFMYNNNCLFWDNDTERLYLRGYMYNWTTRSGVIFLHEINPKTAHVTRLQEWPLSEESYYVFDGIYVPFLAAEASAPAKAQNVEVKAGEEGALTCTLSWDNPSKTYARGGTLEDLTSVVVYRNGEEIWRNDNPVIGGHESFTDNVDKRGFYDYRIVGFNEMGKGDRYNTSLYIGEGDPVAVGDLKGKEEGYGARITWTAPTKGKYDAWINTQKLKYDVVRQPDGTQVATGITECTYLDETITAYGKYIYEVTPRTDYTGISASTAEFVAGPSFPIPASFPLRDYEKFLLWKVVDANGNWYTWTMNSLIGEGVYCQYGSDGFAAADWLISPRIAFKKDQHYKMTFEAVPGNKLIKETLAIGWGEGQSIEKQDSLTQFEILHDGPVTLRVNLPVLTEDKDKNVSFFLRSNIQNFQLLLRDVLIDEDHEGYIDGIVTNDEGKPVEGATVRAANGKYQAKTDANGYYKLMYMPAGKYTIQVVCLGYQNKTQSNVVVNELETTTQNMQISPLPTYAVKGRVIDDAGDIVNGADVAITGYDTYRTTTDEQGEFVLPAVFKSNNYTITIYKLGYVSYTKTVQVSADVELGDITLADDLKAPKGVSITADDEQATITWRAPIGTPRLYRIDDGGYTTSIGQNGAPITRVFGVINRTPATVYSVEYLVTSPQGDQKEQIMLRLIDLDDNGMPNGHVLFESMVPCVSGQWTSFTLTTPVEAPRGYFTTLSHEGWLGLAIDGTGGDAINYPFVPRVNCFGELTTGEYYFLDDQSSASLHHNFCIRTWADPFNDDPAQAPMQQFAYNHHTVNNGIEPQLTTYHSPSTIHYSPSTSHHSPLHIVQDRVRYNVWRMTTPNTANEAKWTLLSEKQQERTYIDTEWKSLPQGTYRYAIKAVYANDQMSAPTHTDSIGRNMLTTVKLHIATNTPDDETWGTKLTLNNGRDHIYTAEVEDNADIVIENVWKGQYNLSISLDGFVGVNETLDLGTENEYNLSYTLEENRIQPFNLMIEPVDNTEIAEMRFSWNFPDYFFEDFEEHEDFVINSPGSIGWNYIDGDGAETGGFADFKWNGAFQPMAFIVYNAYHATTDDGSISVADYFGSLRARSGQKQLTSWAAYGVPNDDWFITPRLYFKQPFTYSFYARSFDATGYPELIEVRYSTTGLEKEDFTEVAMPVTKVRQTTGVVSSDYIFYEVQIPAEARYVALHHVSDQLRILSIDDVFVGLKNASSHSPIASRRSINRTFHRMPALEGQYEVYLDGRKVGNTDETNYVFSHLSQGHHTAGVLASYTSGKTEMTTIDFDCQLIDGVQYVALQMQQAGQVYDLQGRRVNNMTKGVYIISDGRQQMKVVRK